MSKRVILAPSDRGKVLVEHDGVETWLFERNRDGGEVHVILTEAEARHLAHVLKEWGFMDEPLRYRILFSVPGMNDGVSMVSEPFETEGESINAAMALSAKHPGCRWTVYAETP